MSDLSSSELPATQSLILERDKSVLKIWFNRPEAKNALSAEMTEELHAVLDAVCDDRSIRTIVLRGAGGVFCAGGDIKGFKSGMQATDADEVAASNRSFGDLMIKLNEQPQVVIILVEGAAIGGGLGLACVADVTSGHRGGPLPFKRDQPGHTPGADSALCDRAGGVNPGPAADADRGAALRERRR